MSNHETNIHIPVRDHICSNISKIREDIRATLNKSYICSLNKQQPQINIQSDKSWDEFNYLFQIWIKEEMNLVTESGVGRDTWWVRRGYRVVVEVKDRHLGKLSHFSNSWESLGKI